ncbi:MAG: ABC transporter substrate-binding protein [Clostridia bacterium]|nr:ABC transporter substrate-binding protein [Clostridia bacterium]
MKGKRIASLALSSLLLLPALGGLSGCSGDAAITLRVYNWEEYIDEGGKGSFVYDELHEEDETTHKVTEIESDIVDADYIANYEQETGRTFNKNGSDMITDFEHWYKQQYGISVRVEYSTFGTNEDMYNQIKLGNKYDLACPSEYMIMKLASEDLLEPLGNEFLDPNNELNYYIRNVSPFIGEKFESGILDVPSAPEDDPPHWRDYAAGYMWGTTGLIYNPETVDESDLEQGWKIMCDSKYRGKVTTKDNVRDSYFVALAILYRDELLTLKEQNENGAISDKDYTASVTRIMNRRDNATVLAVEKILLQMKDNIFGFETDTGKSDMVKGTIALNFAWSGDAVYALDEAEGQGVSLNYYMPRESANLFFDGWVIPKDANRSPQTKQAAQAFINFMSLPRNAVRNSYYIGYTSVIGGEEMFEYAENTYGAEEDDETAVEYDLSYFFGTDRDYIISVPEEQLKRQLYAQYPPQSDTLRCAVMDYYGKEADDMINELWTRVKGESLDAWAIAVICVTAAVIIGGALLSRFGHRIDFFRRKPKKGYTLVKQERIVLE